MIGLRRRLPLVGEGQQRPGLPGAVAGSGAATRAVTARNPIPIRRMNLRCAVIIALPE